MLECECFQSYVFKGACFPPEGGDRIKIKTSSFDIKPPFTLIVFGFFFTHPMLMQLLAANKSGARPQHHLRLEFTSFRPSSSSPTQVNPFPGAILRGV